jgi:hypothetical protein
MESTSSFTFLLGGHDLEMAEIRKILDERGIIYHDRKLGWNNAKLSSYSDVLNDEDRFIGIELTTDIDPPKNYLLIDHHNENADKPSAIEQVAALLNIELTREQQLISANDKGYIPAMEAYGASADEITEIRRRDREAQGVNKEDEMFAEQSITENLTIEGGITVVKSLTSKFSTITDRLYPCNKLLIYTDNELNYYGEEVALIIQEFEKLIKNGNAYHGGGEYGYFGIANGALKQTQIIEIVKQIIDKQPNKQE